MKDTHAPVLDVLGSRNLELGPFTAEGKGDVSWVHWKMRADENGIVWLLLDKKDLDDNTIPFIKLNKQGSLRFRVLKKAGEGWNTSGDLRGLTVIEAK